MQVSCANHGGGHDHEVVMVVTKGVMRNGIRSPGGQVESTHGLQINWSDFIMSSVIKRVPAYAAIAAYILVHCKYTAFWYIVCRERVPPPPYHNDYCFPTLHVQGSYLSFREASYGKPHEHACNA